MAANIWFNHHIKTTRLRKKLRGLFYGQNLDQTHENSYSSRVRGHIVVVAFGAFRGRIHTSTTLSIERDLLWHRRVNRRDLDDRDKAPDCANPKDGP